MKYNEISSTEVEFEVHGEKYTLKAKKDPNRKRFHLVTCNDNTGYVHDFGEIKRRKNATSFRPLFPADRLSPVLKEAGIGNVTAYDTAWALKVMGLAHFADSDDEVLDPPESFPASNWKHYTKAALAAE